MFSLSNHAIGEVLIVIGALIMAIQFIRFGMTLNGRTQNAGPSATRTTPSPGSNDAGVDSPSAEGEFETRLRARGVNNPLPESAGAPQTANYDVASHRSQTVPSAAYTPEGPGSVKFQSEQERSLAKLAKNMNA